MDYDPKVNLQHHPMCQMARFGKNPFGENLYRVIFAPSRRHLIYGEWPDGSRKASWVKTYGHIGNLWVLERWNSAYEFCKMTEAQWNLEHTLLGPYPSRGEYDIAETFEACGPVDSNLDKLISWIEEGRKRSFWENRTACQDNYDAERKETFAHIRETIRESLPAFGAAAMSSRGVSRGTKTMPILRTAEELGLPTQQGGGLVKKQSQEFEIPVTI